jgi:hypothetical protein
VSGARASLILPYLKLWSNEALELLGDATVWDDVRCPAGSAGPAASNPPFNVFRTNGAGSVGVRAFEFGDPGVEDDLYWDVQWPHLIKLGTVAVPSLVFPHLHWSPADANAGNVGWGIEYTEANIGEAFPLTSLPAPVATAAAGVAFQHQITSYASVSKNNRGISGMFKCRTYRTNAGGIDTYASSVWVHEFDVHVEIDTLGSRTEFAK